MEEVTFRNALANGVMLASTLTLPEGSGPFPAAILISGSGPQDRDETFMGHKPFAVLGDHLSRRGIAVLRYDDRGVGRSTGDFGAATSADFATDARAAVRYLLTRAEIDRNAIGLVGHSEGAMVAPLAVVDDKEIDFMVMLAGPGTNTRKLSQSQRRLLGLSQGQSEEQLTRMEPLMESVYAAVSAASSTSEARARVLAVLTPEAIQKAGLSEPLRDALVLQVTSEWFRYFVRYDPAKVLSRVRVPVLALNGSLDRQVPADENLAAIRAALASNPNVTIHKLDGLNHLFQSAKTGALGEYADIAETMSPVALEMVSDWITIQAKHDGAARPE